MTVRSRVRGLVGSAALRVAERATGEPCFRAGPHVIPLHVYRRPDGPRWGWGKPPHEAFRRLLEARHDEFLERLELIPRYAEGLAAIDRSYREDLEPCWTNDLFIGLDGASLYGFLRDRRPKRYVEVGSGHSTRFAARAKRDGELTTQIISIDPEPRVGIDTICDAIVRAPLESADLSVFTRLEPGDVVLFDGSHRVLAGNDVTVFFLEVLPELASGVLVGIHDIYIPEDYSPRFVEESWTEQYALMATLVDNERLRTVLPCHYAATVSPLTERLNELWGDIGLAGTNAWGSMYWIET